MHDERHGFFLNFIRGADFPEARIVLLEQIEKLGGARGSILRRIAHLDDRVRLALLGRIELSVARAQYTRTPQIVRRTQHASPPDIAP